MMSSHSKVEEPPRKGNFSKKELKKIYKELEIGDDDDDTPRDATRAKPTKKKKL